VIHLRDLLAEALAAPYRHQINIDVRAASFETDSGTQYEVRFPVGSDGIMEVSFRAKQADGTYKYDIETGEHVVYRVLSTVIAIIQQVVKQIKPKEIAFGATPQRIRIYTRYIRDAFPGYTIEQQYDDFITLRRNTLKQRITQFDWTGIKDKP
jgi:hypothetical protein